jgi:aryl-alcohol dehydrogenase-like predicted oxidoreductase
MEYRKLGRTGLKVSSYCLGTMTFGKQVEEAQARRIIDAAIDRGVTFIDCADMYVNGETELILGRALKGVKRSSIVLASKVGHLLKLGARYGEQKFSGPWDLARPRPFFPWAWGDETAPTDIGLARKHIMAAVEASLQRLDTDYLDLYYAHMPDYDTPIDETLRAMDDLVRQGKVRYLGCSNYRAFQLSKALWTSDKLGLARWDCIQPPYNLLARDPEYELIPLCRDEGVGVCPYSPMAAGFLSGKYSKENPPPEGTRFALAHLGYKYNLRYWNDLDFEVVDELKKVAAAHGRSLAQFALAWCLRDPVVCSVVSGATSIEQLEQNIAATDVRLTPEELEACDRLWDRLHPPRIYYGR